MKKPDISNKDVRLLWQWKEEIMFKSLRVLLFVILWVSGVGCSIKTPEIRGVVLDEETKQPVEGAWISATVGVKSKTIGGDVGQVISLDQPHTRTGRDGRFVIPSKKIKKPPFPVSFGTEVDSLGIGASTIDDKGGGITLKGPDLKECLKKDLVEVKVLIKAIERTEEEYFSHLQSLYNYCLSGRFGIEVPPVEGGCDDWELNYAIRKHERYLNTSPKTEKTRSHHTIILEQLGHLYEKKGELEKAIEYLRKARVIRFFSPQDLDREIERIQQKLEGVKR